MNDQYRLVMLGDAQLVSGLTELVRQSNALTGRLLAHLVELEARILHLELGFSSRFSYCVEALGMSEGAAGRRVTAARVCKRFPDVFERVARGDLHLCALCALAPHLNSDNASELFDASRGKTRRQVEELLAVRFPRPDFREQIRRLPVRATESASLVPVVNCLPEAEPIKRAEIAEISASTPQPTLASQPTVASRPQRDIEPLAADRFGVRFTADAELRELLERARALASHRLPNSDLASLIKVMAASFVKQEEKRRFGIGARSRKATKRAAATIDPTPPGGAPESATRHVPMAARREVHERDGRCAFVSATGRRCNARVRLEIDHVTPLGLRGATVVPNLRLLCRAHNQLHARRCFGELHIQAKIAARPRARRAHGEHSVPPPLHERSRTSSDQAKARRAVKRFDSCERFWKFAKRGEEEGVKRFQRPSRA